MRRMTWIAAIILSFALVLSACGTKDAESVVKDLDKFLNSMQGYSGSGTMTLHNGQQPQVYQLEVAYQQPEQYRIKLTNVEKQITQIVLRNDEGVFVLTPGQNKMFRFQSDWPQRQGQVYLYQTLVQSILLDGSRQFTATDDAYVFDVMAEYNNSSLARQKIWLSQDDYHPLKVEVSDTNATVIVDVQFDTFQFDPRFSDDYFSTEANMKTSSLQTLPEQQTSKTEGNDQEIAAPGDDGVFEEGNVSEEGASEEEGMNDKTSEEQDANAEAEDNAQLEEEATEEEDAANEDEQAGEQPTSAQPQAAASADKFVAMEPTYTPFGVSWKDSIDIEYAGNQGLMTRYDGQYSYTLIQTPAKDIATALAPGEMVSLGYTIGQLTVGEDVQTLSWTYHGNMYRLSSANLPESELIKIAQSVQAEVSK